MDLPRWISKEEPCMFCDETMEVLSIGILKEDAGIQVWYECINKDCRHIKIFEKPAMYGVNFNEPRYVTSWQNFKKEQQKEEEKKEQAPDDRVVPMKEE